MALLIGVGGFFLTVSDAGRAVDLRGYDLLLRLLPEQPIPEDIAVVAIDDPAVDAIGTWPWPRDVFAEGLLDLRELGARHLVVDITYPNPSPERSNSDDASEADELVSDLAQLLEAVEAGQIGSEGVARAIRQLVADDSAATPSPLSPDAYLGNVLSATGASVVAATFDRTSQTRADSLSSDLRLPSVVVEDGAAVPEAQQIIPPVGEIQRGADSIGFVNSVIDPDGVKRRAHLVVEVDGTYIPSLGVAPLVLDGYDQVTVTPEAIRLSNGSETLSFDRAPDGTVLIRWHRGQLESGFTVTSYRALVVLREALGELVQILRAMESAGYLSVLPGGETLFVAYEEAVALRTEMIRTGASTLMTQYRPRVETFISDANQILSEESERILLDVVDAGPESSESEAIRDDIVRTFSFARSQLSDLVDVREQLRAQVENATVFLGFTAASTTDIGVTPFEEEYFNIGLHASLLATLRGERELDALPDEWALIIFLSSLAVITIAALVFPPRASISIGLGLVGLQVGAAVVLLIGFSLYVPFAIASVMTFFSFGLLTALSFVLSERDKQQIRLAFEHYLAPDIISELLDDPSKLNVGGESRQMTAMFTDVERFASAIDKLPPASVVGLLGEYLREMTHPILEQRGTIDKYEGDAIVAFFGAPLEDADHARHACEAAVLMRRIEPAMNDRVVRSGLSSVPLKTRIGIHSGAMTVGNLGTEDRLDYTIIGAEVNLAARLENVNKQYGTYLIISEETYRAAGEGLLVRRMDRVRVVGIDRPVRLYELLGHANDATSALREALDLFESGLNAFEDRAWEQARDHFRTVLRIYPQDGPSKLFVSRCDELEKTSVRESWDGVTNLTEK
ncbi:MAG: CHASE2 domain-containing protein [Spirochaetales bacterium]